MVMTEWMKSVQAALKTIPANTPNRLKAAMAKAKLTYKKKGSSSSSSAPHGMKQTHRRHRRSGKGRGRSKRHSKRRGSSRRYRGRGGMVALSPANYVGDAVGSSGVNLQMKAAMNSI